MSILPLKKYDANIQYLYLFKKDFKFIYDMQSVRKNQIEYLSFPLTFTPGFFNIEIEKNTLIINNRYVLGFKDDNEKILWLDTLYFMLEEIGQVSDIYRVTSKEKVQDAIVIVETFNQRLKKSLESIKLYNEKHNQIN